MIKSSDGSQERIRQKFGSGYVQGFFVKDICTLGDGPPIPEFTFGLISTTTICFDHLDAVVGMAYPSLAYKEYTPLIDHMIPQLDQGMFAFFFGYHPREKSELILGGYDPGRIISEVTWHPVKG